MILWRRWYSSRLFANIWRIEMTGVIGGIDRNFSYSNIPKIPFREHSNSIESYQTQESASLEIAVDLESLVGILKSLRFDDSRSWDSSQKLIPTVTTSQRWCEGILGEKADSLDASYQTRGLQRYCDFSWMRTPKICFDCDRRKTMLVPGNSPTMTADENTRTKLVPLYLSASSIFQWFV